MDCLEEEAGNQQVEFFGNRWVCCEFHHSSAFPSLREEEWGFSEPPRGLRYVPKSVQDTDASQFTPKKGLGSVASRKLKDRRVVTRIMCHQGLGPAVGLLEGDGTMPKIMSGAALKRFFPGGCLEG